MGQPSRNLEEQIKHKTGTIQYNAEPTARRFHNSKALYRLLKGSVGSGKTAACVMDLLMKSMQQEPFNGVRKTRWGVCRACFDDQTEILTDEGWKFFKDLTQNESVAMLEDGKLVFAKPTYYYTAPYVGEMINFRNEGVDFCVTPTHKLYASKMRTRKKVWGDFELIKAEDIYGSGMWKFKRDAEWVGEPTEYPIDFFEWLGFWFAEGYINTITGSDGYLRKRITITQTNDEGVEYTHDLFERAKINYKTNQRSDGGYNFTVAIEREFQCSGTKLYELLKDCGKATIKKVPNWIKNAPKEHLNAFLKGYIWGDGNTGSATVGYTSSKHLADDIQEIALRAGQVVNISSRDRIGQKITINGVDTATTAIEYTLTFMGVSKRTPYSKIQGYAGRYEGWHKTQYSGTIYCLEVPTHVVYVRRGGKAHWSSQTYPELKSTTIRTWQEWLPANVCPIVYDVPIRGNFRQRLSDGTICDMEVIFLAIETEEDIKKLLSLELTGIFVNEMRELPFEVFNHMRGRIPRYPTMKEGGATWHGIIGDTNPPKLGHWMHQIESGEIELNDFEIFNYPPAVYYDNEIGLWVPNPDAENLSNLPPNYYKNQIQGNSENYIRVMLAGEYGIPLHGKPVYPQFSQRLHVAKDRIKPDRSLPLIIGFDFGLHPAAIFAQLTHRGKLCILDELAPADEDLDSFIPEYVLPLVQEKYAGFQIQVTGDPSGMGRSGLDKRSAFDVCATYGFRLAPSFSNAFIPRKNAVDYFLNRNDSFSISPHCNYMIEGCAGGYVYEKMKNTMAGSVRHKEKAEKNEYSHGQDALQYICLHILKGGASRQTKKMLNGLGNDINPPKKFLWA